MDFSIIVPAYNASDTIGACVRTLQNQVDPPGPYEIIVVDNGSSDDTGKIAAAAGATVIIERKKGAAAARNAGIRHAKGDIICLTDADCEPTPNWLQEITLPLRTNRKTVGTKGVYLTKQHAPVARFIQLEYEDKYDLLPTDRPIDFIDTYSAAYDRHMLLQNDGFDESMTYLEDQELSFRLNLRGYQLFFAPNAVVYHLHSDTLLKYFRKKRTIGYWKAQVVRRFPSKGRKDSHTPQVMKIQMGLVLLFVPSLIGLLFATPLIQSLFPKLPIYPLWLLSFMPLILFLITTMPFVRKAWAKDRTIALLSPLYLFVRALALGIGYCWGVVKPKPMIDSNVLNKVESTA